jgi:hypothetical protein
LIDGMAEVVELHIKALLYSEGILFCRISKNIELKKWIAPNKAIQLNL